MWTELSLRLVQSLVVLDVNVVRWIHMVSSVALVCSSASKFGRPVGPFVLHEVWRLVEDLRSYAKDLSECGQ